MLRPPAYEGYLNEIYTQSGFLCVDVVDRDNNQRVYYPPNRLTEIFDSETKLKDGRFWNFDVGIRDNAIAIAHDLSKHEALFGYGIGQIICWIAENCLDKWSFHIGHQNHKRTTTMFFASIEDAVLFRLSLQRV